MLFYCTKKSWKSRFFFFLFPPLSCTSFLPFFLPHFSTIFIFICTLYFDKINKIKLKLNNGKAWAGPTCDGNVSAPMVPWTNTICPHHKRQHPVFTGSRTNHSKTAGRLKWYGHVVRGKEGLVARAATHLDPDGWWTHGRPKKWWMDRIKET